ncbi:putative HlyC [Xenorhabdus bovienii str. Jollieti]|uniref:RTX toxin-activating lysine-acyltransferase n=1 Tax=Xenorhabdus bovienii (strain SS-2004) TaxID=406818 RepID=D3V2Y7_XENBS|nr:toxin-activating lysine-acyltransferase [Xenorhabdus bovienii]CBJ81102.1 putative HlyC [Xenorhabdus bovienii SS-2004]CDH26956.1 putative HlyC [Xenorhabdus bovienii str. Jollieti]
MLIGQYDVRAPLILGSEENETEMLGAATWLWMHSPLHRNAPLIALSTLLLPMIKAGQYVLVSHHGQPIFYLSWALFTEETELRYLTKRHEHNRDPQLHGGDRLWILDWIAPFGHSREMSSLVRQELFLHHCYRALYHKGTQRGAQVIRFRGKGVSREQAAHWWNTHPLTQSLPERGFSR